MRRQRKAEEQAAKAQEAKAWRDKSLQEGRKKVASAAAQRRKGAGGEQQQQQAAAAEAPAGGQQQQQKQQQKQKKRQRGEEGEGGLAFNKLDFGQGGAQGLLVAWAGRRHV